MEIDQPPRKRISWLTVAMSFAVSALILVCLLFYYVAHISLHLNAGNTITRTAVVQLQNDAVLLQHQVNEMSDALKAQGQAMNALRQTESGYKRDEWRIIEAEFLVKSASEKLQLESNPLQAIVLLQYADQEIRDLNDAQLFPIRKALASDIAKLQAVPRVDVAGIYAQLAALNEQIIKLPLPTKPAENTPVVESDAAPASWWQRGLQQAWQAIRQIVTVHYYQQNVPPLVMPAQQDFLLQNLHAQVDQAIWALLHHQSVIYQKSLQTTIEWIKQYFDADSSAVQSVLANLTQLQLIDVNPTVPQLTDSLQALHGYFAGRNVAAEVQPQTKS